MEVHKQFKFSPGKKKIEVVIIVEMCISSLEWNCDKPVVSILL